MKTSKLTNRILAVIVAIMLCAISVSAQSVKKHIVQRGETLSTIAGKYGVSQEELSKLNPDAAQFVYVGMELTIPQKTEVVPAATEPLTTESDQATINEKAYSSAPQISTSTEKAETSEYEMHKLGDIEITGESAITYQDFNGDGGKGFSGGFGLEFALGAKAWLSETTYLKGLLGYKGRFLWYKSSTARAIIGKEHASGTFESHSIYVPLYIGAKINNIFIEAGPYFDYIVYGKSEISSGTDKIKGKVKDGKFSTGLSVKAGYKDFGVSFGLGLTDFADAKKCKDFFIGIVWSY